MGGNESQELLTDEKISLVSTANGHSLRRDDKKEMSVATDSEGGVTDNEQQRIECVSETALRRIQIICIVMSSHSASFGGRE